VGNEGGVVGGGLFKWDVVESSFQVNHANPSCPPQLCLVPARVVQLVLILVGALVDRHNILADSVRLAGLLSGY
jgi:hypothetical protein